VLLVIPSLSAIPLFFLFQLHLAKLLDDIGMQAPLLLLPLFVTPKSLRYLSSKDVQLHPLKTKYI